MTTTVYFSGPTWYFFLCQSWNENLARSGHTTKGLEGAKTRHSNQCTPCVWVGVGESVAPEQAAHRVLDAEWDCTVSAHLQMMEMDQRGHPAHPQRTHRIRRVITGSHLHCQNNISSPPLSSLPLSSHFLPLLLSPPSFSPPLSLPPSLPPIPPLSFLSCPLLSSPLFPFFFLRMEFRAVRMLIEEMRPQSGSSTSSFHALDFLLPLKPQKSSYLSGCIFTFETIHSKKRSVTGLQVCVRVRARMCANVSRTAPTKGSWAH